MRARFLALALLATAGCSSPKGSSQPPEYPVALSEWNLFEGNGASQTPRPGVIPYDVIATLFADQAMKRRFLVVASSGTIAYQAEAPWDFPVGSIVVKTFSFPVDYRNLSLGEKLLETRLLVREADGWSVHTYVWNAEQTEAFRRVAGARVPVQWIDANGVAHSLEYRVPNTNQCLGCHGEAGSTHLLGPRTRQMNRDYDYGAGPVNQIDHLATLGLLDQTPPTIVDRQTLVDPFGAAPVDQRARSYLDANCAHCHNPEASLATSSGLYLGIETVDPAALGICKSPVAAGGGTGGFDYDILPGDPAQSIMVYRMASVDPEIKMPEMPSQLSDADGVAVISAWIAAMTPPGCL